MKKMNKKGFTLVEMLVVIAIIAILVAILIPTVLGATKKAKAATDAANLRSALAEVEIIALTGGTADAQSTWTPVGTDKTLYYKTATPKSTITGTGTTYLVVNVPATGEANAYYIKQSAAPTAVESNPTYDIDYFAKIADGTNS